MRPVRWPRDVRTARLSRCASRCAIGIDVGGTKVLGVALDPASPRDPLASRQIPTPHGASALADDIATMVAELVAETGGRPGQWGRHRAARPGQPLGGVALRPQHAGRARGRPVRHARAPPGGAGGGRQRRELRGVGGGPGGSGAGPTGRDVRRPGYRHRRRSRPRRPARAGRTRLRGRARPHDRWCPAACPAPAAGGAVGRPTGREPASAAWARRRCAPGGRPPSWPGPAVTPTRCGVST